MIALALVVLAIIGTITWIGWRSASERETELVHEALGQTADDVATIAHQASDTVTQLRDWATQYPAHAPVTSREIQRIADASVAAPRDGLVSLDGLAALPADERLGQIIATPASTTPLVPGKPSALQVGLALVLRLRNGQLTAPFLKWTYFFSADRSLLATAPFQPSAKMLGGVDIRRFLHTSWTTYEVTTGGTPEKNPGREPYWTRPYLDQAGAGMMISNAAPVYWGDRFVGVVGTDVSLAALDASLREFSEPPGDGELYVVDDHGDVLADRRGGSDVGVWSAADVLPRSFVAAGGLKRPTAGTAEVEGKRIFTVPMGDVGWTVVYVMEPRTFGVGILGRFLPQIVTAFLCSSPCSACSACIGSSTSLPRHASRRT